MLPRISTVIPTYRRPRELRRAILSVLAQDVADLEVLVFDNASGDETAQVVAEIAARDPRVHYHCHERNIGGVANFRHALAQARTPFFTLLCDDDVVLPGFFGKALRGFEEHPQAAFWAGATVRMTAAGVIYDSRVESWPREGLFLPPEGLLAMTGGRAPLLTGAVFRKAVIDQIGITELEMGTVSDYDLLLRLAGQHPFIISKQPVAIFTLTPDSLGERAAFSMQYLGWQKIVGNVTCIPSLSAETREQFRSALLIDIRRMLLRRAAYAIAIGNHEFAQNAGRALKRDHGQALRGSLLLLLSRICAGFKPAQQLYSALYRAAVRMMLRRRMDLQTRLGGLAQHLLLS